MKKIKYGILGCGSHALRSHALPGKKITNLNLNSICDISIDQLEGFESEYGQILNKYTNPEKFLNSDLDAVFIATPDEFHFQNLIAAIEAEKHVFMEKPLAVNSVELRNLESLLSKARQKDLVVTSCHPRRVDPPFIWLKNNLEELEQELGMANSFHFDFSYHKPSRKWKHNRGLLLDHANHEIDLVNYLFGQNSFKATKLDDSYDSYHMFGKRKDDIVFEFKGRRKLETRKYLEFTTIRFERGDLYLNTINGLARVYNHDENKSRDLTINPTDYETRGKATMINFANTINKKETCYLTSQDLYVNTAVSVMLSEQDTFEYDLR